MKILVLSDSHGNIDNMVQAVEKVQPRMIFPMHYRKGDMGFDTIAEPETFLDLYDSVTVIDGHTLQLTEDVSGVVFFSAPRQ